MTDCKSSFQLFVSIVELIYILYSIKYQTDSGICWGSSRSRTLL